MKTVICELEPIYTLEDLQHQLHRAIEIIGSKSKGIGAYVTDMRDSNLRLQIVEECLTDGSVVYNLRFKSESGRPALGASDKPSHQGTVLE